MGDIVRIAATRKLSKEKAYKLSAVLRRANVFRADVAAALAQARDERPAISGRFAHRIACMCKDLSLRVQV